MRECSFCSGELEEQLVQHEHRWKGALFIFEEVPVRVCVQCGERYFDVRVVKAMESTVTQEMDLDWEAV